MESTQALSRSRERLAVSVLAVAAFVVSVNVNTVGPMMPFLAQDPIYAGDRAASANAAVPQALLNQLLWVTSAAAALASLILGPLVDRAGRWLPLMVGSAVLALATGAHALADSHGQLLALRALSGFGGGLVFTSASAAVADLVPLQRRAGAMGLFSAGMFLAMPLGLPIAVQIAKQSPESWRWAFGWLALPGLFMMVGFVLWVPRRLGRSAQRVTQLQVLREPHVLATLLSVMLYTGAFFTMVQLAPSWLDQSGLVAKEKQEFLWLMLGLSTVVGSLFLPRLADRIGKRNMVLISSAGVAICMLLFARVETVGALWLVGLPMTMLAAARTPALQALMSEIVEPRMRGTLMGLRAAAVNFGAFAFAGGGGALYASHGFGVFLYAAALVVVVSYLIVRYFVRVRL